MLSKLQIALLKIEEQVEGQTNLIIKDGYIEIIALDTEPSGFVSASIRQNHTNALIVEITRELNL